MNPIPVAWLALLRPAGGRTGEDCLLKRLPADQDGDGGSQGKAGPLTASGRGLILPPACLTASQRTPRTGATGASFAGWREMTQVMVASAAGRSFLRIDVCVCTFRREAVCNLIASLGAIIRPPGMAVRVIVADNDTLPSARDRVEAAFAAHGLEGVYLHAPDRNISIARNACLDAATAPFLAFIDDDETARPDWLVRLLARLDETGADVVFGRVSAVYLPSLPAWLSLADLHSPEAPIRNGVIDGGYTSNVLMRQAAVGATRFNPQFGRSGGEDTTFFAELQARGVRMAYASDAVVEEPVTPQRASLRWLAARAFRSGQTYGLVRLARGDGRLRVAALSLGRIAVYLARLPFSVSSPVRWRRVLVRTCLHGGILASATGQAPITLYGSARV